jgi:putative ABC transport system substrate-binding protein
VTTVAAVLFFVAPLVAEAQSIVLDIRSADGNPGRYPDLAADLVRLKVDVIVADGNAAIEAVRQATASIPIIRADEVVK